MWPASPPPGGNHAASDGQSSITVIDGQPVIAAASDGLHPLPHLPHVVVLHPLFSFPSVLLLRLPELDSEFLLYLLELLCLTIFEGLLMRVQLCL